MTTLGGTISGPKTKLDEFEKEMESMLDDEREDAQNDIHGRGESAIVEEELEFQQEALRRLDEELLLIHENREAFELAQTVCPEYVNADEFRLMFLRSTMYDANLAAQKIVTYWCRKLELFGPDRAFRKLSILDLGEEDRAALEGGGVQILPVRDEFGRGILLSQRAYFAGNMARVMWFFIHDILEDVDVQRKGVVIVGVNNLPIHDIQYKGKYARMNFKDLNSVLPIRIQALHAITRHAMVKFIGESVLFAMGRRLRARCIFYDIPKLTSSSSNNIRDKYMELLDKLESYGIPSDAIPVEIGGTNQFDYTTWLEQKWIEAEEPLEI